MGWREFFDDTLRVSGVVALVAGMIAAAAAGFWFYWAYVWNVPPPIRWLLVPVVAVLFFVLWFFIAIVSHRYFRFPNEHPFYVRAVTSQSVQSQERTQQPQESPTHTSLTTRSLSRKEVSLAWLEMPPHLGIRVMNETEKRISDFRVFVQGLHWQLTDKHTFVEVPEFYGGGNFKEIELPGGSRELFPGTPVTFTFIDSHGGSQSLYFQGHTADGGGLVSKVIKRGGVWRVSLRCQAMEGKTRTEALFFSWTPGNAPKPRDDLSRT